MRDAVFFLYANASGIVDDERRKYVAVDGVSLHGVPLMFAVDGPILRATLKEPKIGDFTLKIDYHGVVPRNSASGDSMGGMLAALGGNPQSGDIDYGLYAYSGGVLSLGASQLAVRRNGKWVDEQPEGLSYADASVRLTVPGECHRSSEPVFI